MITSYRYILTLVMAILLTTPAIAGKNQHSDCDSDVKIKLGRMGMVNEASLQVHIDKVKAQMKKVRHARGSHESQKRELKQHLLEMQAAMQTLHNQVYTSGCESAMQDASLETRLEVMEKRMGMMEQMIEQVMEHLSEQTP